MAPRRRNRYNLLEEKTQRNRRIWLMHLAQPDVTMRELAQAFGISFQRIHQLIKRAKATQDATRESPASP